MINIFLTIIGLYYGCHIVLFSYDAYCRNTHPSTETDMESDTDEDIDTWLNQASSTTEHTTIQLTFNQDKQAQ